LNALESALDDYDATFDEAKASELTAQRRALKNAQKNRHSRKDAGKSGKSSAVSGAKRKAREWISDESEESDDDSDESNGDLSEDSDVELNRKGKYASQLQRSISVTNDLKKGPLELKRAATFPQSLTSASAGTVAASNAAIRMTIAAKLAESEAVRLKQLREKAEAKRNNDAIALLNEQELVSTQEDSVIDSSVKGIEVKSIEKKGKLTIDEWIRSKSSLLYDQSFSNDSTSASKESKVASAAPVVTSKLSFSNAKKSTSVPAANNSISVATPSRTYSSPAMHTSTDSKMKTPMGGGAVELPCDASLTMSLKDRLKMRLMASPSGLYPTPGSQTSPSFKATLSDQDASGMNQKNNIGLFLASPATGRKAIEQFPEDKNNMFSSEELNQLDLSQDLQHIHIVDDNGDDIDDNNSTELPRLKSSPSVSTINSTLSRKRSINHLEDAVDNRSDVAVKKTRVSEAAKKSKTVKTASTTSITGSSSSSRQIKQKQKTVSDDEEDNDDEDSVVMLVDSDSDRLNIVNKRRSSSRAAALAPKSYRVDSDESDTSSEIDEDDSDEVGNNKRKSSSAIKRTTSVSSTASKSYASSRKSTSIKKVSTAAKRKSVILDSEDDWNNDLDDSSDNQVSDDEYSDGSGTKKKNKKKIPGKSVVQSSVDKKATNTQTKSKAPVASKTMANANKETSKKSGGDSGPAVTTKSKKTVKKPSRSSSEDEDVSSSLPDKEDDDEDDIVQIVSRPRRQSRGAATNFSRFYESDDEDEEF
jgi:hypothetical protein